MKKIFILLLSVTIAVFAISQNLNLDKQKLIIQKDTTKKVKTSVDLKEISADSAIVEVGKYTFYKKNVHASYYHDKFNGRRTSSGIRFDNNKFTAAHKLLPFGTKLKVTNLASGKSVIVEVIDRGPFVKSREIDLSKRAFMDIAKNKGAGVMFVNIEILDN